MGGVGFQRDFTEISAHHEQEVAHVFPFTTQQTHEHVGLPENSMASSAVAVAVQPQQPLVTSLYQENPPSAHGFPHGNIQVVPQQGIQQQQMMTSEYPQLPAAAAVAPFSGVIAPQPSHEIECKLVNLFQHIFIKLSF